jgi:hypothetical protein
VGLGAGEDLVDRKQPVESIARDPAFLVDQLMPQHRDLRYRPAPGEESEAQEPGEDR